MKFRNQLAVNLVKLLAPVHSYPSSEINIVDTAFTLADRVCARIEVDAAMCDEPKNANKPPKEAPVDYAAEAASAAKKDADAALSQPEERRFFLLTDEGELYPNKGEDFATFIERVLFDFEGK